MGNQASLASRMLNPWKRDVMPDKPPAHHGKGGSVGGGGSCAADTDVSKQSYVGRDETMVGSSKVVVSHIPKNKTLDCFAGNRHMGAWELASLRGRLRLVGVNCMQIYHICIQLTPKLVPSWFGLKVNYIFSSKHFALVPCMWSLVEVYCLQIH